MSHETFHLLSEGTFCPSEKTGPTPLATARDQITAVVRVTAGGEIYIELTHAQHSNSAINGNHLERKFEFLGPDEQKWKRKCPEHDESNELVGSCDC